MNYIDTLRLTGLFNKSLSSATIIGCGAIGSKLAIELCKLGVNELFIYDNDKVESHNLSNQAFIMSDIGKPKVAALKERIAEISSMEVVDYEELFTKDTAPQTDVVFLCVDNMETRKEIIETVFRSGIVNHVIETRMGVDELRVYHLEKDDIAKWVAQAYYPNAKAETSACGTSLTVGATASICASLACWQYMKLFMKDQYPVFEIIMSLEHYGILV